MTTQWMRPWIWWVLLIVAPPVWLLLITLRFAPEILSVVCVLIIAILGFWVATAALTVSSETTWVEVRQDAPKPFRDWAVKEQARIEEAKPISMEVYKAAISECALQHQGDRELAAECAKARIAKVSK